MPQAGFEPTIPASEQPKTHALDLAVTGIGQRADYKSSNPAGVCRHYQHQSYTR
jgi:hypothetical protein